MALFQNHILVGNYENFLQNSHTSLSRTRKAVLQWIPAQPEVLGICGIVHHEVKWPSPLRQDLRCSFLWLRALFLLTWSLTATALACVNNLEDLQYLSSLRTLVCPYSRPGSAPETPAGRKAPDWSPPYPRGAGEGGGSPGLWWFYRMSCGCSLWGCQQLPARTAWFAPLHFWLVIDLSLKWGKGSFLLIKTNKLYITVTFIHNYYERMNESINQTSTAHNQTRYEWFIDHLPKKKKNQVSHFGIYLICRSGLSLINIPSLKLTSGVQMHG